MPDSDSDYFGIFGNGVIAGLTFWAISPILLSFQFLANGITKNRLEWKSTWRIILPHLGSIWVIGLGTYLFRLLLILIVGKPISGFLFSAYAAGGMLNSVYTSAFGPADGYRTDSQLNIKQI